MDLIDNEHVSFEGHPSWRSILGFYFVGLVIAATGIACCDTEGLDHHRHRVGDADRVGDLYSQRSASPAAATFLAT